MKVLEHMAPFRRSALRHVPASSSTVAPAASSATSAERGLGVRASRELVGKVPREDFIKTRVLLNFSSYVSK